MDATPPAAAGSASRPSPSSGIPLALRRLAIGLAGLAVAVLAGAACALSFDDLRALAIAGQAEPGLAYLYPAGFDALLVVALISVPLLRGARLLVRLQAGLVLLLLLAAAATAAVATASGVIFDVRQAAVVVALLPWVMLVIAFWLLSILVKHAHARRADLDGVSDAGEIVPFDSDEDGDDKPEAGAPIATSRSRASTPVPSSPLSTADTSDTASRSSAGIPIASPRPDTADTASRSSTAASRDATSRTSMADGPAVSTDPYPVLSERPEPMRHAPSPARAPEVTAAPETPSVTDLPAGAETTSEPMTEAVATPEPEQVTDSATERETATQPVTDSPATTDSASHSVTDSPATTGSASHSVTDQQATTGSVPEPVVEQARQGRRKPQRPIRWGDLVRPNTGDVLVYPRPKKTPSGTTPPAEPAGELPSTAPAEPADELPGAAPAEPAADVVVDGIADDDLWDDEDTVSVVEATATESAESIESAELAEPSDLEPPQASHAEPSPPSNMAGSEPAGPAETTDAEGSEPAAERPEAEPAAEEAEPAAERSGSRGTVPLVAASDEASAELSRRYGEAAEEIAERFARPRPDEAEIDTQPLRQLRDAPDPAHASGAADPEEQTTSRRQSQSKGTEGGSVPLAPPSGRMRSTPRPPS